MATWKNCSRQLNGKELSYNNLVDVDAAVQLIHEFAGEKGTVFGIIKHTNVCGIASRATVKESWDAALAGDPESAFGGVLVCNQQSIKQQPMRSMKYFLKCSSHLHSMQMRWKY
jgi:AICAR transformylase/IMP cyclohydrolase PurH